MYFRAGGGSAAAEWNGAVRRVKYEAVPGRRLACLLGAAQQRPGVNFMSEANAFE